MGSKDLDDLEEMTDTGHEMMELYRTSKQNKHTPLIRFQCAGA
jgi:hypothetical protein